MRNTRQYLGLLPSPEIVYFAMAFATVSVIPNAVPLKMLHLS